jgi:Ca-activated chloride channel homolog
MKRQIFVTLFVIVLLASLPACAPAATPAPVAQAPRTQGASPQGNRPVPTAAAPFQPAPRPAATARAYPTTAPDSAWENPPQEGEVNPRVKTQYDHLSTFALDVDTASYTEARRYIQGGSLPPTDAVRVEEFVNYFKQDYPTPADVSFGIYADAAPNPFDESGDLFLRIGIQGYEVPASERLPLMLTLVVDISGSMADDNKLDLVKQSVGLLVKRLRPQDSVAIVAYTTEARVVLYPVSGRERRTILDAIDALQPENSTNLEQGLEFGYRLANQVFDKNANNRVVLCTDGVANEGNTDAQSILDSVSEYARNGIFMNTIGVGMGEYNDSLLEQLADHGNGTYAYIDTIEEAERLFVEELTSTIQTIAQDARAQVDFNVDTVTSYRQVGYEDRAMADSDFRNDSADAGEVGAGHSVTALYVVRLRPGTQGRIATVQLRWKDPQTQAVQEINGNFNTWDVVGHFKLASPRYRLAVMAAEFAEVLRQSPYAQRVNWQDLTAYANQLADELREDRDVNEFAGLVSSASHMSGAGYD